MNEEQKYYDQYSNIKIYETLDSLYLDKNNSNEKLSHIRDVYLTAEKEYVLELLKDEEIIKMILQLNLKSGDEILKIVEKIMYEVENNLIPYEKMDEVEKKLIILLSAVYDEEIKEIILTRDLKKYLDEEEYEFEHYQAIELENEYENEYENIRMR